MPRTLLGHPGSASTLDQPTKAYALVAATAGVSTLALSQPADAKVVITNTNTPIPFCFVLFPCSVSLDLKGDGVNDFKFSLVSSYTYSAHSLRLHVVAHNGGGVIGTAGGAHGPYASDPLRGAKIGASDHFSDGKDTVEVSYRHYNRSSALLSNLKLYGKWGGNHPNRFLGVKLRSTVQLISGGCG